ncbi:PfkB family carbohydrate kinase [Chelativorans sp. AA-79]|uniref:PfkB family carbohydrate kinase n=1 Tax=Chelativorans sp. AA-79 TaxID=3028735 RepID=UPI0023F7CAE8|nr:PfkB family carbohydrate kinase [Chelativorans sp. AA-79]WEX11636.1 PfkB family carbohydrate kinase [Chelativorans sp. AA-79]
MTEPLLFAFGGAHIERFGHIRGTYAPDAFNPGTMRESVGGSALLAARAAAQRGLRVKLMSLRGGDAAGLQVAAAIENAGIEDCSAVFLDRATPSSTAILTQDGSLAAGLDDMALYEFGFPKLLRPRRIRDGVAEADAVLCEAEMPSQALELLAGLAGAKPIFALAVSAAKSVRLMPVLGRLSYLFMNRQEACRLAGLPPEMPARAAAEALAAHGLAAGVITDGGKPVLCFETARFHEIAPFQANTDEGGSSNVLAGAAIAALMRGLQLPEAIREGTAAAKLMPVGGKTAPKPGVRAFRAALDQVPPPQALS